MRHNALNMKEIFIEAKNEGHIFSLYTLDVATYPNRLASTGVLHGEAAKANVSPAR